MIELDTSSRSLHNSSSFCLTTELVTPCLRSSTPGSVQGFRSQDNLKVENVSHLTTTGQLVLALHDRLEPNGTVDLFGPNLHPL